MASTSPRFGDNMRSDDFITVPVEEETTIYAGTMVALNAAGYAVPASAATGLTVLGKAAQTVVNAGADGDVSITVELSNGRKSFRFNNAGTNPVTITHVGKTAYVADNDTVTSSSTGTSAAGTVTGLDSGGVWIRFAL